MSARAARTAGIAVAAGALFLFVAEKRRPLRRRTQPVARRTVRNLFMGALSMAVVQILQQPLVEALAARAERRRSGLAQRLPAPAWARDAAAFLLLDYGIYLWHILTHRVPALWRLHLVHHVDRDLDVTTALRFHFADMAVSIPWRAGQVAVAGASPRALGLWQRFFFLSVLFHHSNLRLPQRFEAPLMRLVMTPRLHGIHHSVRTDEMQSNWSSGLIFWDRLHGSFRADVPQEAIVIGVPGCLDPRWSALEMSLKLPFAAPPPAEAAGGGG